MIEFQGTKVLGVDGLVGRETMGRLDRIAGGDIEGKPEIGDDPRTLGAHVAEEMERLNRSGALSSTGATSTATSSTPARCT